MSSGQLSRYKKARSKSSSERPAVNVSVKPLDAANDNLIDQTCQVWRPRLGRDLSREDVRQIKENVVGFFSVLAEWSRTEMPVRQTIRAGPLPPTTRRAPSH